MGLGNTPALWFEAALDRARECLGCFTAQRLSFLDFLEDIQHSYGACLGSGLFRVDRTLNLFTCCHTSTQTTEFYKLRALQGLQASRHWVSSGDTRRLLGASKVPFQSHCTTLRAHQTVPNCLSSEILPKNLILHGYGASHCGLEASGYPQAFPKVLAGCPVHHWPSATPLPSH